jgi:hypothetical protein
MFFNIKNSKSQDSPPNKGFKWKQGVGLSFPESRKWENIEKWENKIGVRN